MKKQSNIQSDLQNMGGSISDAAHSGISAGKGIYDTLSSAASKGIDTAKDLYHGTSDALAPVGEALRGYGIDPQIAALLAGAGALGYGAYNMGRGKGHDEQEKVSFERGFYKRAQELGFDDEAIEKLAATNFEADQGFYGPYLSGAQKRYASRWADTGYHGSPLYRSVFNSLADPALNKSNREIQPAPYGGGTGHFSGGGASMPVGMMGGFSGGMGVGGVSNSPQSASAQPPTFYANSAQLLNAGTKALAYPPAPHGDASAQPPTPYANSMQLLHDAGRPAGNAQYGAFVGPKRKHDPALHPDGGYSEPIGPEPEARQGYEHPIGPVQPPKLPSTFNSPYTGTGPIQGPIERSMIAAAPQSSLPTVGGQGYTQPTQPTQPASPQGPSDAFLKKIMGGYNKNSVVDRAQADRIRKLYAEGKTSARSIYADPRYRMDRESFGARPGANASGYGGAPIPQNWRTNL